MVFESSSESRKSWDGRKMTRQCIPNFWCDRRKRSRGCHGGFAQRNTYCQGWRGAEWSHRRIAWNECSEVGGLLRPKNRVSDGSYLEIYSVTNRKPVQFRQNRRDMIKYMSVQGSSEKNQINGCAAAKETALASCCEASLFQISHTNPDGSASSYPSRRRYTQVLSQMLTEKIFAQELQSANTTSLLEVPRIMTIANPCQSQFHLSSRLERSWSRDKKECKTIKTLSKYYFPILWYRYDFELKQRKQSLKFLFFFKLFSF